MIPPIANQFVAGESIESALKYTQSKNQEGVAVILNLLGEHYSSAESASDDVNSYQDLVTELASHELDACISVKPSQLGIDIGADVFRENLRTIVEHAHNEDVFVWCDMEDADTTDTTLNAFVELTEEFPWTVGQCLQSNLKRTQNDLEQVTNVPGKIRIVKGAYDEPPSIAYKDKERVDEAFRRDIKFLFENCERGVAVGTHDPEMLQLTQKLGREYSTKYEIQMLMGVREDTQRELAEKDVDVWQYAPYGNQWLSYFYRRVRERKENALFAARAILGI